MKKLLFILLCSSFGPAAGLAQLIHLQADGIVTDKFGGESWWSGEGSGIGVSATMHIYYEQGLTAEPADPAVPARTYRPDNAVNNFWRLQYGNIDISAPFEFIQISDSGLSVYFSDFENGFSTLDLGVTFISDPSPGFELPLPPLPPLGLPLDPELPLTTSQSTWAFDTGWGFGLEEGGIQVRIDRLEGTLQRPFQPVPEPATYAFGALLLLAFATAGRWRMFLVRASAHYKVQ